MGTMKENDRIRTYARQRGIDPTGQFKNSSSKKRLVSKLSSAQQKRLRLKVDA